MFDHGWNNYYEHAFPEDEVKITHLVLGVVMCD